MQFEKVSAEEKKLIARELKKQYIASVKRSFFMIALVLAGFLLAGALVQLAVYFITGGTPHFYGFITYYVAISLGMMMVCFQTEKQHRKAYRSGTEQTLRAAKAVCVKKHAGEGRIRYTIYTGLRYFRDYFVQVRAEDGSGTEMKVKNVVYEELKEGDRVLVLHYEINDEGSADGLVLVRES